MKPQGGLFEFFLKEWLMIAAASGLALTSIHAKHVPVYSWHEIQVLYFLFMLFVTVKGLENSGLLLSLSQRLERGKAVPLKLVVITFFLSMVVTNDVALLVIVPLTLALKMRVWTFSLLTRQ